MVKRVKYSVAANEMLVDGVYRMRLTGDASMLTAPGQFINLALDGFYLRRPISVCDWDENGLDIIYKVVGQGTAAMAKYAPGRRIDALSGLGNGFSWEGEARPLIIGGGVGIPPLYGLTRRIVERGARPIVVMGFNTSGEVFLYEAFCQLGVEVVLCTADGSAGVKGFVTDGARTVDGMYDTYYACGPEPMLRAIYHQLPVDGQLSFEERMGCGFGACMGCSCETVAGAKRICVEGPVLRKGEILWRS